MTENYVQGTWNQRNFITQVSYGNPQSSKVANQ